MKTWSPALVIKERTGRASTLFFAEVTMELEKLKRDYMEAVYKTEALMIKEEPFDLQSGRKSHIYLNHRNFLSHYNYLELIARAYLRLLEPLVRHYRLCAVDSVMSPSLSGP